MCSFENNNPANIYEIYEQSHRPECVSSTENKSQSEYV